MAFRFVVLLPKYLYQSYSITKQSYLGSFLPKFTSSSLDRSLFMETLLGVFLSLLTFWEHFAKLQLLWFIPKHLHETLETFILSPSTYSTIWKQSMLLKESNADTQQPARASWMWNVFPVGRAVVPLGIANEQWIHCDTTCSVGRDYSLRVWVCEILFFLGGILRYDRLV